MGGRASRGGGRKADLHWVAFTGGATALGAGVFGAELKAGLGAIGGRTQTLMRTRGNMVCWVDGAPAVGVLVLVSLGMHLVPEGTGSTVTVSPLTEPGAGWFYHEAVVIGYDEPVTDVIDVPGLSSVRSVIDIKAMRVIRPEIEIQLVIEATTVGGAGAINVHVVGRFLFST